MKGLGSAARDGKGAPRSPRGLWAGCAVAVGACAMWALRPLDELQPPSMALTSAAGESAAAPAPAKLDLAAFNAPLWVAAPEPPPSEAPPPPPPPPPPVKVQLLAIVRGDEGLRAALYDPETDTLATLSVGESIGRCTVEEVTESSVRLKDGENTHTLSLEEPGSGGKR